MKTNSHFQRGALHFSLAVVVAGFLSVGTFIYNKIDSVIKPTPTVQVVSPVASPTVTSQIQPPSLIGSQKVTGSTTTGSTAIATSSSVSSTTSPATATTTNTTTTANPNAKDCGTDMNCFIAQAATCGPASVEYTFTLNLFGAANTNTTGNYVVNKTATAGVCSWTSRVDKQSVVNTNSKGVEVGPAQPIADYIGSMKTCSNIPADKLVTLLTNLNKGNFSSNDLAPYACTTTQPNAMHETDPFDNLSVGTIVGAQDDYTIQITAIHAGSIDATYNSSTTKEKKTFTAQLNTPVTVNNLSITLTSINQADQTVAITVKN